MKSRAETLYWEEINEVPDTPDTASSIDSSVLAVTGRNDRDYRWQEVGTLPFIHNLNTEIAGNTDAIVNLGDVQSVTVATSESYEGTLTSQAGSNKPLILVTSAAISGTYRSNAYTWPAGQVLWVPPASVSTEALFVLPQSTGGGGGGNTNAIVGATISGRTITLTRASGATIEIAIPATDLTDYRTTTEQDMVTAAQITDQAAVLISSYLDVEPGTFIRQIGVYQFHVTIHGVLTSELPDVDNLQIVFQGQLVHAEPWTARAGDRVIDFEVDVTESRNVINNLRTRTTVQVQIRYRDGNDLVLSSAIREIPVTMIGPTTIASAATISVDATTTTVGNIALATNTTLNVINGNDGDIVLVRITQDTTGSRTLTLSSAIQRGGRDAPVLSTAAGRTDLLYFQRFGTAWHYIGIINNY